MKNPLTNAVYANGVIPTGAQSPFAMAVLAALPSNNVSGNSNNYTTLARSTDNQDKGDARIDYSLNQKIKIFGRFSKQRFNIFSGPGISGPAGGGGSGYQYGYNTQVASGLTYVLSPRSLLEARIAFTWTTSGKNPATAGQPSFMQQFNLPGLPAPTSSTPSLNVQSITGFTALGTQSSNPAMDISGPISSVYNSPSAWVKSGSSLAGVFNKTNLSVPSFTQPFGNVTRNALRGPAYESDNLRYQLKQLRFVHLFERVSLSTAASRSPALLLMQTQPQGEPRVLVSRRLFLQQAMSAITIAHGRIPTTMLQFLQQGSAAPTSPDSLFFGIGVDGRLLDARSFYRVLAMPGPQDRLCFDVSNNRIACSVNQQGMLERFAIQVGIAPIETKASPVGAYVEKILYRNGPMPLLVSVGDSKHVPLHELGQPEIHLQDGLFPRFEWSTATARLKMRVFAPQTATTRPRAIIVNFTAASPDMDQLPVTVHFEPPSHRPQDPIPATPYIRLLVDSERGWTQQEAPLPIIVNRDPSTTLALLMDATENELERTKKDISALSANAWFDKTREYHVTRYGHLTIPDAPFYAELYVRAAELTRQSLILDGTGQFGGSFNGSDLPAAANVANVWMRDCFYSSLPQSFLCPEIARSSILFFLEHGVPSRPIGEHADRFPGAKGVTNSLGKSVAGIVLAGIYYQNNDDRQFFLDHPEILLQSLSILNRVLESRREEVFLFPSIYVSDGESRGDFHTGSNIFLWRSFLSVARLAQEVYEQEELAALWHAYANRLHEAILTNCIVLEEGRPRFVEGAMQDHTMISGHDGEESDVTLAAFYDFCGTDDPPYLNAAREAISPSNPYAIARAGGHLVVRTRQMVVRDLSRLDDLPGRIAERRRGATPFGTYSHAH